MAKGRQRKPETHVVADRALLADFFEHNPAASFDYVAEPVETLVVTMPWGDPSVGLIIIDDSDPIIDVLNNVYLPERFTALWHRDSDLFEIIFTADPLPANWADLHGPRERGPSCDRLARDSPDDRHHPSDDIRKILTRAA